jgi:tyrosyl-tRNA synthetase
MPNPFPPVREQLDAIRAAALEIQPEEALERKLERSRDTGTPLLVKQGFDPTRPDLHIGHAVSLGMLRIFQDLGHQVVFVVGDYTARVGDPSGRSDLRPQLGEEEIRENARTYQEQAFTMLDRERTRVVYNGEWLAPLRLEDLLRLTAQYTVARMLERDDFQKRFAENRPISLVEFMYPLMQAYDSVELKADVELGGSDQKFNLLVARTIQERYGQEPQVCVLLPLLRGTDGERKMSKSYDNYVGITDAPAEQYGRTMSIPDSLLEEWIELTSGLPAAEKEALQAKTAAEPYTAKRALARAIVARFHGAEAAGDAEARFDQVHRQKEIPDDIPEHTVAPSDEALQVEEGEVWLPRLLTRVGLASSNSEAVRMIRQGAVSVEGERVDDHERRLPARGEYLVQRGKRRFARVRFSG